MKRIFKMMALLLCLTATAGMIGCSKDDSSSSGTENGGGNSGGGGGSSQNTSLAGTKWSRSQTYYYGDYIPTESKELSFTSSTSGKFHRHLDTGGSDSEDETRNFTYTYSNGHGTITIDGTTSFSVNGNVLTWCDENYQKNS